MYSHFFLSLFKNICTTYTFHDVRSCLPVCIVIVLCADFLFRFCSSCCRLPVFDVAVDSSLMGGGGGGAGNVEGRGGQTNSCLFFSPMFT